MSLKAQIDNDLKQALLSGDKQKATTLRGLKSVILNEEIRLGERDNGLSDNAVIQCLQKESKKRQEAADLYIQAGSVERADQESAEKVIIDAYLPEQMSEEKIQQFVDAAIAKEADVSPALMGKIIGAVKAEAGPAADGAIIARIVKEKLQKG